MTHSFSLFFWEHCWVQIMFLSIMKHSSASKGGLRTPARLERFILLIRCFHRGPMEATYCVLKTKYAKRLTPPIKHSGAASLSNEGFVETMKIQSWREAGWAQEEKKLFFNQDHLFVELLERPRPSIHSYNAVSFYLFTSTRKSAFWLKYKYDWHSRIYHCPR